MKKIIIPALFTILSTLYSAQFTIKLEAPKNYEPQEAYLYTLNGSKDILLTKENIKGNFFTFKVPNRYVGMMKVYFPQSNDSFNLISENKDINVKFDSNAGKISEIKYLDEANSLMDARQDVQRKKDLILPALTQIKQYYKPGSDFGVALDKEIQVLSSDKLADLANLPFSNFYINNYTKFIATPAGKSKPTQDEIINFLSTSNEMLESSSLMRPLLVAFLNAGDNANVGLSVDKLLKAVNVETPRGQTVLSELIDIFDVYEMNDLKEKYLTEAKNLKCTINERLSSTIKTNQNVEMGAKFPNFVFVKPIHTAAKSIYDVKADRKVVMFWASTCSHCEQEIPRLIENYNAMKAKNIEIIGLSLDNNAKDFQAKANVLPWINDSELKGWNSSFAETYNVHATPTYFILDKDNKIIDKPNHVEDVLQYLKLK